MRALALVLLCHAPVLHAADLAAALAALERGDYKTAVAQLDELVAQGDPVATTRLASLYQEGRGVPKDATRAAMLYEQAAARGYADAQFNLANMYLLGEGVPQDDDWAFTYYREAAKQGHVKAQKNVAEFYRAAGLTPPPEEVNPPAAPAQAEAPPPAESTGQSPVAAPPVTATTVTPDATSLPPAEYSQDELNALELARRHGIRIAEAGSLPPPPPPLRVPRGGSAPTPPADGDADDAATDDDVAADGVSSANGIAAAKQLLAAGKPTEARPLLEAEAGRGSAEAQYLLAQLLVTLSNGAQDNASALGWLQRAAAGGYADAQFLLGARYERGEGVMPDEAEAVTWYRAAARQGHPEASERLRAIYRDAGVPMPDEAPPPGDRRSQGPARQHDGRQASNSNVHDSSSQTCTQHACSLRAG